MKQKYMFDFISPLIAALISYILTPKQILLVPAKPNSNYTKLMPTMFLIIFREYVYKFSK